MDRGNAHPAGSCNTHDHAIKRLIAGYKRQFRIPENFDHYSPEDFSRAERRYVKLCLAHGAPPTRGGT